jgi:hypothetical protein
VIGSLRRPVSVGDRAVERALAQLRRESRGPRWLWYAGIAGVAAALAIFLGGRHVLRQSPRDGLVTFALAEPSADSVVLIGDFNDWNPGANPLRRTDGRWSVTLKLKPGRYRYSFVVDGSSWRADPRTPPAEDDFGTPTSVVTVTN